MPPLVEGVERQYQAVEAWEPEEEPQRPSQRGEDPGEVVDGVLLHDLDGVGEEGQPHRGVPAGELGAHDVADGLNDKK